MKRSALALLVLLPALATAAEPALPAQGVVFRLTRAGLGEKPAPEVEILADGTVRLAGQATKAKLPKSELEALLAFVVTTKSFFQYDENAVGRAIARRESGGMCGVGVTTTGVTVVTAAKQATRKQMLLETYAGTYGDIAGLVDLRDIARRLRFEGELAKAGGRQRVAWWLKIANARLKKREPKEKPLAIETFEGVTVVPQGEIALRPQDDPAIAQLHGPCATFVRRQTAPWCILSVSVQADGKAAAVEVQRP